MAVPGQQTKENPNQRSADFESMSRYWHKVESVLGGLETMKENRDEFLPKNPGEPDERYNFRTSVVKLTNVFADIVENLAQRPFARKLTVSEDASPAIQEFSEDVDGRGNNLHVFASWMFYDGIAYAVDFLLVDYTKDVPENATVAQERALGVRPYWVRYHVSNVLAAYTAMVNGREEFVHVRLRENATVREGFGEKTVERIRVLQREDLGDGRWGLPTWEVWEKKPGQYQATVEEWVRVQGPELLTIGIIPLVPFIAGRRKSQTWRIRPPMRDALELQIDLYQQECALKFTKLLAAFPILTGNGVAPETDSEGNPKVLKVGPGSVLYAPNNPTGGGQSSWDFIEPDGQTLGRLADDITSTIKELRELGRQPLTAQSGNLTRITTAFAASKGNAAIQAWALNLKDSLELAFKYTAMWLKETEENIEVMLDTDFDLSSSEEDDYEHVLKLRETGDISREAALHEAKRRSILDPDYDAEEDLQALLEEMDDTEEESVDDGPGTTPPLSEPDDQGSGGPE